MNFKVEGKTFQQQLQAVSKVINSKNTISIFDNFLIRVEGDRMSITGSDQENMLTAYMDVLESSGDGLIAVNARRLLEITKEIDNQPIEFDVNDDTKEINLRFLNGHFTFMGVDGNDYPDVRQTTENSNVLIIPVDMALKGINNTIYAASTDNNRPVMAGIYWDIHNDDITFVSSDTHKLARYINREKTPGVESSFILPLKSCMILRSLIGKDDADLKITYDEKGGIFEVGDYILSTLFVTGRYPNYNRVIPTDSPFEMTIDRVSLINAMRRVTLFSSKSSNLVVFEISADSLHLSSQDLDYGTSAEEVVTCSYQGNPMTIGFNGAFMIEILSNIADDTVIFRFSDPARPAISSPFEQKEGEDLVIIQMPMQVL